jgi:Domain of unknown function (DUF4439)
VGTPVDARALAGLLAVEHGAVYACEAAGGSLADTGDVGVAARALAYAAYADHAALRDRLTDRIMALGAIPPAALPAYRLPPRADGVAGALTLLAALEDRTAAAAHDATGVLAATVDRGLAADMLAGAAVRAQRARLAAGLTVARATNALPGI